MGLQPHPLKEESSDSNRLAVRPIWNWLNGDGLAALIMRGASGAMAVRALGAAAMLVMHVLLARVLGPEQYGIYVLAFTWATVLALFANAGMPQTLVRFVASYRLREEWGKLRGLLYTGLAVTLAAGLILMCVGSLLVWLLRDRLGAAQVQTFWLALAGLPFLALLGVSQGALQGLRRVVLAYLPQQLLRPMLVTCLVGTVALTGKNLTSPYAMGLTLIATTVAFGVGTGWSFHSLPGAMSTHQSEFKTGYWLRVGGTFLLLTGSHMILRQTDILMLGSLMDAKHAGLYNSASRLSELVTFGNVAMGTVVAPLISELYTSRNREAMQEMATLAARAVTVFSLIATSSLIVLGRWVLAIFGPEFVTAYLPLMFLLAGQVAIGFMGMANIILTMTGHEKTAAQILGSVIVVNVALNAALIPAAGLLGAATATAASTALWGVWTFLAVRKRLGINPTVFVPLSVRG